MLLAVLPLACGSGAATGRLKGRWTSRPAPIHLTLHPFPRMGQEALAPAVRAHLAPAGAVQPIRPLRDEARLSTRLTNPMTVYSIVLTVNERPHDGWFVRKVVHRRCPPRYLPLLPPGEDVPIHPSARPPRRCGVASVAHSRCRIGVSRRHVQPGPPATRSLRIESLTGNAGHRSDTTRCQYLCARHPRKTNSPFRRLGTQ